MSERDELADAATKWLVSYRGSIDSTALILAFKAGARFRKPRVVSTVEELEALPVGSVVMDNNLDIYRRLFSSAPTHKVWVCLDETVYDDYGYEKYRSDELVQWSPATVLFEPSEKETKE